MTPAPEPIQFFNRRTGRLETEQIYGEGPLRWLYSSTSGRIALNAVAKRAFFSHLYGFAMDAARSTARIDPFIRTYGLDPEQFLLKPDAFASFNEFFCRELKPGARPVDQTPGAVVFPADGRHLAVPDVSAMDGFFVKGQKFDLPAFLGSPALAEKYARGTLVLSRLCPVDYHRFHFPCAGVPGEPQLLNGPLFSVSPVALRQRLAYLWENKRVLTELKTESLGTVLIVEIGATNVGSIVQTYQPGRPVERGAEKGCFKFGGSSTVTIFEPGRVRLADDLLAQSARCTELYAWVGDTMGRAV